MRSLVHDYPSGNYENSFFRSRLERRRRRDGLQSSGGVLRRWRHGYLHPGGGRDPDPLSSKSPPSPEQDPNSPGTLHTESRCRWQRGRPQLDRGHRRSTAAAPADPNDAAHG